MYRGMPPNGKLYSLIDSNVEEDLLKGEVNSLEFRNLSWVAPAVKNLKKFKNLTRESLNLSVTVDLWPWTFGGWRKVSETLILSLEEDFSSENMTFSFSTENQSITLDPLDYIALKFQMTLFREKTALFCIKYPAEENVGSSTQFRKEAIQGEKKF